MYSWTVLTRDLHQEILTKMPGRADTSPNEDVNSSLLSPSVKTLDFTVSSHCLFSLTK